MQQQGRSQTLYQLWVSDPTVDEATQTELLAIADAPEEIEERFYKDLEFGTGGLRGVMGAGTNRINAYTVGRATQGLARYVLEKAGGAGMPAGSGAEKSTDGGASGILSVAIAHDSRHLSAEFALETALVLAGNGIRAYLFDALRPTPELSFAVRELGAAAGVVITASHNPPEYNGYKVYGPDGGQLTTEAAGDVTRHIQATSSFAEVKRLDRADAETRGLLVWIGEPLDRRYLAAVLAASPHREGETMADEVRIVYTPLHGAGNLAVRSALAAAGFGGVHVVRQQELPDGDFPTVKSPNPEEREALALALEEARVRGADIALGTDPDCDRVGAVARDGSGEYVALTGNQSGALMLDYLLQSLQQQGQLPEGGVMIKTIVTSELGAAIAAAYGVETLNTLTGFKYIGEKITEFTRTGEKTFLFGYEESYGYLAGTYARDKDAVLGSLLLCQAAAYHKAQGRTLIDALNALYQRHGYFMERTESRTLKGKDGAGRIRAIMEAWRSHPPASMDGITVDRCEDFSQGLYGLPAENVIKFSLADGSWFCLRPSGTEPKIKCYFAVRGTSADDAGQRLETLIAGVMRRVDEQ